MGVAEGHVGSLFICVPWRAGTARPGGLLSPLVFCAPIRATTWGRQAGSCICPRWRYPPAGRWANNSQRRLFCLRYGSGGPYRCAEFAHATGLPALRPLGAGSVGIFCPPWAGICPRYRAIPVAWGKIVHLGAHLSHTYLFPTLQL